MAKKRKPRRKLLKGVPKKCYFHEEKKEPTFQDVSSLQKFVTERGKIIPRSRNGLCAKHQKTLTKNIKYDFKYSSFLRHSFKDVLNGSFCDANTFIQREPVADDCEGPLCERDNPSFGF